MRLEGPDNFSIDHDKNSVVLELEHPGKDSDIIELTPEQFHWLVKAIRSLTNTF
jgi:hypothetical protein